MGSVILIACLLGPAAVRAQDAQRPSASRPLATATATPERSIRHTSAHADRVVLVPTAETQPAGTLFLSSYEIVGAGVGYAFSDRMQVSLVGATTFTALWAEINVKANLLRSRWLRIAAQTSIDYARGEDEELPFGRIGGTLQLCFDLPCRSSMSAAATVVAHDAPDTVLPLGVGLGFIAFLSHELSLLLEYAGVLDATELELIDLPVYLVSYGIRISGSPTWSLDLAFARALRSEEGLRTGRVGVFDLLGAPLAAFTYRREL
ncbi:MAG TPA: hypothetical protein VK509_11470 [Polyangiales bacterium]|nr:hypothetical protein [Polyangiales bacterium]